MEYEEKDDEVISLLAKLKETGSGYPADLLVSRRQSFVKQIAAFGFGAGAALVLKDSAKAAGGSSIPPIAGTILEVTLIVAIVAEAGYVAINHRDKVLDLFQKESVLPTVQEVNTEPNLSLPTVALPVTGPTLVLATIEPTIEITATPTIAATPLPSFPPVTVTAIGEESGNGVQENSTPRPHDDNGNHYGQTPRPERTRESGEGNPELQNEVPQPTEKGNDNSNDHGTKVPGK